MVALSQFLQAIHSANINGGYQALGNIPGPADTIALKKKKKKEVAAFRENAF